MSSHSSSSSFSSWCEIEQYLDRIAESTQRLLDRLEATLTDELAREDSLLPGWTRGHVLTHIARNADSHRRRLEGAARGEVVDQYVGGPRGRVAEIEAGAGRPADDLLADVAASAEALRAICADLPTGAWDRLTRDVSGRERPAAELPVGRWQEVEIHHVDLGLGYCPDDWPADFVDEELQRLIAEGNERLPSGMAVTLAATDRDGPPVSVGRGEAVTVEGTAGHILAYLLGRPSTVTGYRLVVE